MSGTSRSPRGSPRGQTARPIRAPRQSCSGVTTRPPAVSDHRADGHEQEPRLETPVRSALTFYSPLFLSTHIMYLCRGPETASGQGLPMSTPRTRESCHTCGSSLYREKMRVGSGKGTWRAGSPSPAPCCLLRGREGLCRSARSPGLAVPLKMSVTHPRSWAGTAGGLGT